MMQNYYVHEKKNTPESRICAVFFQSERVSTHLA